MEGVTARTLRYDFLGMMARIGGLARARRLVKEGAAHAQCHWKFGYQVAGIFSLSK